MFSAAWNCRGEAFGRAGSRVPGRFFIGKTAFLPVVLPDQRDKEEAGKKQFL